MLKHGNGTTIADIRAGFLGDNIRHSGIDSRRLDLLQRPGKGVWFEKGRAEKRLVGKCWCLC